MGHALLRGGATPEMLLPYRSLSVRLLGSSDMAVHITDVRRIYRRALDIFCL